MSYAELPSRRLVVILIVVQVASLAALAGALSGVHRAATGNEEQFVALATAVTRMSQAQAAAERMVAVGRAYMLTDEPELLARAQAADAKLSRTLQAIGAAAASVDRDEGERLMDAARRYRAEFAAMLWGENGPRGRAQIVQALRTRLIPARERLLSELEELASEKLEQLEETRAASRRVRAGSGLLLAIALLGTMTGAMLSWVAARRVWVVVTPLPEPPPPPGRIPGGEHRATVYRMRRRGPSPGPDA
jgi:CHASE3 domain sensor protein